MGSLAWLGSTAAAVAAGFLMWRATALPPATSFVRQPPWYERLLARAMARWQSGWSPATRLALDVLQETPQSLQRLALVMATGSMLVVLLVIAGAGWPWAIKGAVTLGAGGLVAWGLLPRWIQSQARRHRNGVMADYPVLLVMLRFYLSLDYGPLEALLATIPLLGKAGQRELRRILADVRTHTDSAPDAFTSSRQRISQMHWTTLMDALAQNWGRRLTTEGLRPLSAMLISHRDEAARRLVGQLDIVVTLVPIMALFGTLTGGMFVLVAGLVGGHAVVL